MILADQPVNDAAEWFIKLQDGDLSEAEYTEWQEWLAKSPANRDAFARAEICWQDLDNITDPPWDSLKNAGATQGTNQDTKQLRRFISYAASIAASIVIILSIGLFLQKDSPDPAKATTYQTARSEHKTILLDDGSKVTLGARSIVNVNYSQMTRHMTLLRGEAVFEVARDKTRPFIVQTGKGTTTAVGTKFNIHASDQNVTVTVLEGIVEVNPTLTNNTDGKPLPRVSAGKAVSYYDDGHISEVVETNVEAAVSWEKGLLVRVDTPLASVIADVNRYSSREIIIGDPALNDIRFTGTVLNDGIDNWLRGLSVAYPIKILDSGHDAILLLKKEK